MLATRQPGDLSAIGITFEVYMSREETRLQPSRKDRPVSELAKTILFHKPIPVNSYQVG